MALIDFPIFNAAPRLSSGRVTLRLGCADDYDAWRRLRDNSREHLIRWEPDWTDEEASLTSYRALVRGYARAARRGVAAPYFVFRRNTADLIGGVNLINISRGAAQSATLGYWLGAKFTGHGYASEAVGAVLEHGFETLRLHRIEAACQPGNSASARLLEGLGFRREGLAERYLRINGRWRDHIIYAKTACEHSENPHRR
ncbi:MAG: GNAT family protein [Pseudomonadota bacterium]